MRFLTDLCQMSSQKNDESSREIIQSKNAKNAQNAKNAKIAKKAKDEKSSKIAKFLKNAASVRI